MTKNLNHNLTRRNVLIGGAMIGTTLAASAMLGAPAIAQSRKKVTMAGINILCYSPMFVAQDLGYFADEGLDVNILETQGGSQTTSAMLSGDAKVITSNFASPILLAGQGKHVKHIVGLEMNNIYAFVVRPALDIKADNVEALVAGLKGKRIGVASLGSGADTMGSAFLADNGLNSNDVIKIATGTGGTALAAMRAGGVDATITYEPDLTQMVNSGAGKIAFDLRNTKSGTPYSHVPSTTMQATSEWIKSEPEAAAAVVRAIVRVHNTFKNDEKKSLEALAKRFPGISAGDVKSMYEGERASFRPAIPKEQFDAAEEILMKAGTVQKKVGYEDVVAAEFAQLWA